MKMWSGFTNATLGVVILVVVILAGMAFFAAPGWAQTADDIIAHCRLSLAGYKCPKQVFFTDGLPRNASGKVLKKELLSEG